LTSVYDARVLTLTDRAVEVLRAAQHAANRFDPSARLRIRREGSGVAFELTDAGQASDQLVETDGVALLVESGIEGTVDAGEHGTLVLEP
jgi:Fe-S cluster assembly iron-binding protein IscA